MCTSFTISKETKILKQKNQNNYDSAFKLIRLGGTSKIAEVKKLICFRFRIVENRIVH